MRDSRNQFLWKGDASLVYKRPLGRPSKLTKMPRQELAALIQASPQASDYTSGWWNPPRIQDLMQRCFGVEGSLVPSPSICTLLQNLIII
jgi:hypothetical protein